MDKNILLLFGKHVKIRNLQEGDKQAFRDMHYDRSMLKIFFDDMILNAAWESQGDDGVLTGTITGREGEDVYGFCQLRDLDTGTPEALVQMTDEWSDKGFGSEAAALLVNYAFQDLGLAELTCEVDRDDAKANHIAVKVGGTLLATESQLPQEIIDFGLEDGTLAEEDITYINRYRISPR